jgi:ribosomal protein L13
MTQAVRCHLSARYPSDFIYIVDCGDYVIVTNSIKVKVSGKKEQQLLFRKHSMFPGGLKETPYKDMKKKHPEEVRFHVHMCL